MIRLALEQRRVLIDRAAHGGWEVYPEAQFLASPYGPIVFVVHGYNNDQEEAEASYAILRKNLRGVLDLNPARLNHIWELYWPGYLPKGTLLAWRKGPGNLISALSYSHQEGKTTELGRALAEHVLKIPRTESNSGPEVIFIAHSLGCRVVLEALRFLVDTSVRVLGICLMAAAVPVFMVEEGGELRSGLKQSKEEKVYILCSTADGILRWCFRPVLTHQPFLRRLDDSGILSVANLRC
jgi:hypothetical protein